MVGVPDLNWGLSVPSHGEILRLAADRR